MGMFTTVVHPETGEDIQFKCGNDDCERYKVGDSVNWLIFPHRAGCGKLLDDVYDGEYGQTSKLCWVIIKDHKIHAVEAVMLTTSAEDAVAHGQYAGGYESQRMHFYIKYGICALPVSTWSDAAWAYAGKQQEESQRRQRQWAGEDFGKTAEERVAASVGRYTRAKMLETGLIGSLLPPAAVGGVKLPDAGEEEVQHVKILDAEGKEVQHVPALEHRIEFFAYETMGAADIDIAGLYKKLMDTDDTQRYREAYNGCAFEPPGTWGGTVITVLQFLEGLPFNNLALAYILGLEPEILRVSYGTVCTDSRRGRVTVFLNSDDTIERIDLECAVGYGCGANVDSILNYVRKHGKPPETPPPALGNAIGHIAGLERVDFS